MRNRWKQLNDEINERFIEFNFHASHTNTARHSQFFHADAFIPKFTFLRCFLWLVTLLRREKRRSDFLIKCLAA